MWLFKQKDIPPTELAIKASIANNYLIDMMDDYDETIAEAMRINGTLMMTEAGHKSIKLSAREYFDRVVSQVYPDRYAEINS